MKVTSNSKINVATIEYSDDETIAIPYVAILLKKGCGCGDRLIMSGSRSEARKRYLEKAKGKEPDSWNSITYSNSSETSRLTIKVSDIVRLIGGEAVGCENLKDMLRGE